MEAVSYAVGIQRAEVVFLENVWQLRVQDARDALVRRLLRQALRLPTDLVDKIARHASCRRVAEDAVDRGEGMGGGTLWRVQYRMSVCREGRRRTEEGREE